LAAGQVTGYSEAPDFTQRGVVWTRSGSGSFRVTDLGALPGGSFTTGHAINTGEQVAGYSDRSDQRTEAALWSPTGSATFVVVDLGTLPGGAHSEAYGINPAGQVVGSSDTAGPNASEHAVLWTASG